MENLFRPLKRTGHRGISGDEGARLDCFGLQGRRQRAHHIGEAAGLDDRVDFRGDREDANGAHVASPSIIACVIRQMPCSVVRNLFASCSGSSPTTSPTGIRTPRSMTTFANLAPSPTST